MSTKIAAILAAIFLTTACSGIWEYDAKTDEFTQETLYEVEGKERLNQSPWRIWCKDGGPIQTENFFPAGSHLKVDYNKAHYMGGEDTPLPEGYKERIFHEMIGGKYIRRQSPDHRWGGMDIESIETWGFAKALRKLALHCEMNPAWLEPGPAQKPAPLADDAPAEIRKLTQDLYNPEPVLACAEHYVERIVQKHPKMSSRKRLAKAVKICASSRRRQEKNAIKFADMKKAHEQAEAGLAREKIEDREKLRRWFGAETR